MTVYLDISAAVHRRAGLGRYAERLAIELAQLIPDQIGFFYNAEHGIQPLMLLPLHAVPTVLTVHDLIFRHLPQYHKPLNRWYLNLTMPLYCRRATRIITISEASRRDLVEAYKLPPEKINVIYEAADVRFRPQSAVAVALALARYDLPSRYLLFVGTIEPRKNLTRLLVAFEKVYAQGLTDALVIVGKQGWLYDGFFAALERSPARSAVIMPGYVADADLPIIYAGAQVLLLPSLYEGFGLPILEAMSCGTPVICSNTSSLPEVAGDAARLVDPKSANTIAEALEQVLTNPNLQGEMRERGLAQARRFSWERAAQETLALYRQLANL
jgi:glycosyltransferase involved in cell wall biosynthesis